MRLHQPQPGEGFFIFCFKMIPVSALVVLLVCSPIAEAFVCTGYTGWYGDIHDIYTVHIRNIMILEHGVRKKKYVRFFFWVIVQGHSHSDMPKCWYATAFQVCPTIPKMSDRGRHNTQAWNRWVWERHGRSWYSNSFEKLPFPRTKNDGSLL